MSVGNPNVAAPCEAGEEVTYRALPFSVLAWRRVGESVKPLGSFALLCVALLCFPPIALTVLATETREGTFIGVLLLLLPTFPLLSPIYTMRRQRNQSPTYSAAHFSTTPRWLSIRSDRLSVDIPWSQVTVYANPPQFGFDALRFRYTPSDVRSGSHSALMEAIQQAKQADRHCVSGCDSPSGD